MKINFNNSNKDSLDPFDKLNHDLEPDEKDSDKIEIDPFGGKVQKTKPSRKKSVEKINKQINLEKEVKEKKPLTPLTKKIIFFSLLFIFILFLILILKNPVKNEIKKAKQDIIISNNQVMMPDITGLTEEEAIKILDKRSINVDIEYMYNQYFDNGTVIKCSIDPNNPVEKKSTIKMYVCKDNDLAPVPIGVDYFNDIILPKCPASKGNITLTDVKINDIELLLVLKNDSNKIITNIKYTLGYLDEDNIKFINRSFIITDLKLNPGESISDKISLDNSKIKGLSFEYAEYKYIEEK